jgi:hypothetical protein
MKNTKTYRLSQFDKKDIDALKTYIRKGFIGFLSLTLDDYIDNLTNQLADTWFKEEDVITLKFEYDVNGGTLLAVLGTAHLKNKNR